MKVSMSVRHSPASGATWKNSSLRVHIIAPRELVLKVETAILRVLSETEAKS